MFIRILFVPDGSYMSLGFLPPSFCIIGPVFQLTVYSDFYTFSQHKSWSHNKYVYISNTVKSIKRLTPSQTIDFNLVCKAPLSNARHTKGTSTQKMVDPLPCGISHDYACCVVFQWDNTFKWLSYPLLQAGTVLIWPQMYWKGRSTQYKNPNITLSSSCLSTLFSLAGLVW